MTSLSADVWPDLGESALEQALIARYGSLGQGEVSFLLYSGNGSVFTSRRLSVRSCGPTLELITPYCPQQNGIVEEVIRTVKDRCAHRHRFETAQHASRIIGDWISFYNHLRPH